MKKNALILLVLVLISTAGFFAIYLKEPPKTPQEKMLPAKVPAATAPLRIGIIGESIHEDFTKSFNEEVLTRLFEVLKKRSVQAIFFTGNLTFGWTVGEDPHLNPFVDISSGARVDKGLVYKSAAFRDQLRKFNDLRKKHLPPDVAFYPMMGTHEAIGNDSAKVFREEFGLINSAPLGENMIAYSVSMADAFFVVIPTDYYDAVANRTVEHAITAEMLMWLKKTLGEAALTHRFIFVLGHEPAFSTPSIFFKPFNLDNNPEKRDALWQILKDNGVLAYFASHEHLYDRSNRSGVWQIISGGGGSLVNKGAEGKNAFYHCLLLTIPIDKNGVPKIEVLDIDGSVVDEFQLKSGGQPLFQRRIS